MYEIKVLDSNEFDSLPYEGIDDSLGVADVKAGKVFVRDTGIHELNRYLINHEIDHLVEDHATDEDEHGIRHKKFFKELFLPLFTGYNAQQKSWSPLGILDPKNLNPPPHEDAMGSGLETGDEEMGGGGDFLSNLGPVLSQFGLPGGDSSSQRLPDYAASGANISSGLNSGIGGGSNELPPEVLAQLRKGNYSQRFSF